MKKTLNIILVVLLAVAAFAIGYYDQTKLTKCELEKKKVQENADTTKEVSYKVGEELVKRIENEYSLLYSAAYVEGFDKITSNHVLYYAVRSAAKPNNIFERAEVAASDVKNYIKKYFGEDFKYEDKDVICEIDKKPFFIYKDGKYKIHGEDVIHGHDGAVVSRTVRDSKVKVEDISYNDKDIVVVTKIAYAGNCDSTCGPKNAYYSSPVSNEVVYGDTTKDYEVELTDAAMETIKDKLPTTTFTFSTNKDGSYYLSNVTVK